MNFFRVIPLLILSRSRSGFSLPKINWYHKLLFIVLMAMALLTTIVQQKTHNVEQLTTYSSHVFQKFFQKRWKHILDQTQIRNDHTQKIGRQLAILQQNFQSHNQLYQQSIQKSNKQSVALTTQKQRLYQEIDQIQTQVAPLITSIENLQNRINTLYQQQSKMISANKAIQTQITRIVHEQRQLTRAIASLQKRVVQALQNVRLTQNDLQKEQRYLRGLTTLLPQYVHGIDQQRVALLKHQLALWRLIPINIKVAFRALMDRWNHNGRHLQISSIQKRSLIQVQIDPSEIDKKFYWDSAKSFHSRYYGKAGNFGDFHPLAHAKKLKTANSKEGWEFTFRQNQEHGQSKRRLYVTRLLLYYDESTKLVHARIYKAFEGLEQSLDWSLQRRFYTTSKVPKKLQISSAKEARKWVQKVDQEGTRQVRVALAEIDTGIIYQTPPRKWKDHVAWNSKLINQKDLKSKISEPNAAVGYLYYNSASFSKGSSPDAHRSDHGAGCSALKDGLHVMPDLIFTHHGDHVHTERPGASVFQMKPHLVWNGVASNRERANKGIPNPRHNPDVTDFKDRWVKHTEGTLK